MEQSMCEFDLHWSGHWVKFIDHYIILRPRPVWGVLRPGATPAGQSALPESQTRSGTFTELCHPKGFIVLRARWWLNVLAFNEQTTFQANALKLEISAPGSLRNSWTEFIWDKFLDAKLKGFIVSDPALQSWENWWKNKCSLDIFHRRKYFFKWWLIPVSCWLTPTVSWFSEGCHRTLGKMLFNFRNI